MLPTAIAYGHELAARVVQEGDVAVDATAGNGHDTLFLARLVGPAGRVHAFDVQEAALQSTSERLERAGVAERVTLHHAGHEQMRALVPGDAHGRVRVVAFNLGYLPGGDKALVTQPETTVRALDASLELLASGGLVTVVCYTGHPGGQAEAEAIAAWAAALDQRHYHAARYGFLNQQNRPPHTVVVERLLSDG